MSLNLVNITNKCNICDSSELAEVFKTLDMPLTGLYLDQPSSMNEFCNDQILLQCEECGHAQLKYIISPNDLYDTSYTHRSTKSNICIILCRYIGRGFIAPLLNNEIYNSFNNTI